MPHPPLELEVRVIGDSIDQGWVYRPPSSGEQVGAGAVLAWPGGNLDQTLDYCMPEPQQPLPAGLVSALWIAGSCLATLVLAACALMIFFR